MPHADDALSTSLTLMGRSAEDPSGPISKRARVREAARVRYAYETGAQGASEVTVLRSEGDLDRGGVVLTLEVHDREGSYLPVARPTDQGIEVHLAGEAEAEAMLLALQHALLEANADRARRVGVRVPH